MIRTGTAKDTGDLDELDGDLCGFHFDGCVLTEVSWVLTFGLEEIVVMSRLSCSEASCELRSSTGFSEWTVRDTFTEAFPARTSAYLL